MKSQMALLYFSSEAIRMFCEDHPIDWRSRAKANGAGNRLTPTSAMAVFFELLAETGCLPTQRKFVQYAWQKQEWTAWRETLTPKEIEGIEARLYRNFYPSAIDTLYVWALLVESGKVAYCRVSLVEDIKGKCDIVVFLPDRTIRKLALRSDSDCSRNWAKYKRIHRGNDPEAIEIALPMERPKGLGNKRWYEMGDLQSVFNEIDQATHNA